MEALDAMSKEINHDSTALNSRNSYWGNITVAYTTLRKGLMITLAHLYRALFRWKPLGIRDKDYFREDKGVFTVQFPHESLPIPETGRYKLHNEIDDCIVCDKCANICPVDCIEIESIRSAVEFGKTSDGTPRRIYAARFDIDMAKCSFCGLCTTVCPTECLTMTPEFDFSEYDVNLHKISFAVMTKEEIDKRKKEWEDHEKQQASAGGSSPASGGTGSLVRPKIKFPGKPVIPSAARESQPDQDKDPASGKDQDADNGSSTQPDEA